MIWLHTGVSLRHRGMAPRMMASRIRIAVDRVCQHAHRRMLVRLALLLVFGSAALQGSVAPLPTIRHAPPVAHLVETRDNIPPESVAVRTLGLNMRVRMDLLGQRPEAVLDN